MATSMLMVLLHRSLTATFSLHPSVLPRARIDDVSFQWVGARAGVTRARGGRDSISELYIAVRQFVDSVRPLGLVVQFAKSGFVASTQRARKRFATFASALKLAAKKAMRNLGHELHGTRVFRIQEEARVRKTTLRSRKLRALRRAVSDRVSRLWRTGLMPAGGHGAGVSGVSDGALRRLRTQAGMLVGAKPMPTATSNQTKFPFSTYKTSSTIKRAGSATRGEKIETPEHTNKMLAQFSRINLPNFYKLDKITYSRNDISDIGKAVGRKLDELEHLVDYERRKNFATQKEKVALQ